MLRWRFIIGYQIGEYQAACTSTRRNSFSTLASCNDQQGCVSLRITQYFKHTICDSKVSLSHLSLFSFCLSLLPLSSLSLSLFRFQLCDCPWPIGGSDPRCVPIRRGPIYFQFSFQGFTVFVVYFQVYPLFAAVGAAIGICGFQLVRNVMINPEVRSISIFFCIQIGFFSIGSRFGSFNLG